MNNMNFKKIGRMILIRVFLAPAVILILVCGTLVYYFFDYSRNQVQNELVRIVSDHNFLIDQFFKEKIASLKFIASSYSFEELKKPSILKKIFHNLQTGSKAFVDLGVFDCKGNHISYAGPYDLAGKNYAQTKWFNSVKNEGLYISDVFLGYRKIPHFVIAVSRHEGDKAWYLRATVDTYYFNELVENIRIRKTGEAYIVNREGIFQTRRRSGGNLMETDPDYGYYRIGDEKTASFTAGKKISQKYLYALESLKHTEWVMIVRQEMFDAYAPLIFSTTISIIIILGGGTIVVAMGYVLASGMGEKLHVMNMEKQEMKTQLIIAGKLAEVGEMSTGIAHEINNPLQVMKSEVAMVSEVVFEMEEFINDGGSENFELLKDSVNQIGIQIERCGRITQGLLDFARKTEKTIQPIKIQKFLPEFVKSMEKRAKIEDIRIILKIDSDIPVLMTDSNQLQQVFLNLFNNAIYALNDRASGKICVCAFQEDSEVVITVTDNGCGFSTENMRKAFMPFFTTKPVGEGTGLGLSSVYGIVKGLGGEVTLESELNVGSVFTIRLPFETQHMRNIN